MAQVHRILTRTTYIGEHEFNKRSQDQEMKPEQRSGGWPVRR